MVRLHRKMQNERDEFRETFQPVAKPKLMAILSQAEGTPSEGAETT